MHLLLLSIRSSSSLILKYVFFFSPFIFLLLSSILKFIFFFSPSCSNLSSLSLLKMSQQFVYSHGSKFYNRSRYVCKCGMNAPLMTTWTYANQIVISMDVRCIRYVLVYPLMFTDSMLMLWYWM